jgi:FMN-dependent NADH-azoreductase
MKTLLTIQASIFGPHGQSSQLADKFIANWRAAHPNGRVVTRNLDAEPIPHLTLEHVQAFSTPPEQRTAAQREMAAFSDGLIEELRNADDIVFAMPMYNYSVPSTVRAYFDQIARAGVTFRYTEQGSEGLIKGKRTYVLIARGGIYDQTTDTQTAYLKQFLGFIGLNDIRFIYAEGLAMGDEHRERGIKQAHAALEALRPAIGVAA